MRNGWLLLVTESSRVPSRNTSDVTPAPPLHTDNKHKHAGSDNKHKWE